MCAAGAGFQTYTGRISGSRESAGAASKRSAPDIATPAWGPHTFSIALPASQFPKAVFAAPDTPGTDRSSADDRRNRFQWSVRRKTRAELRIGPREWRTVRGPWA